MGIVQRTLTRGVVSVDVGRIGFVEGFKYDRSRFEVQGKCLAAYVEQLNLDRLRTSPHGCCLSHMA